LPIFAVAANMKLELEMRMVVISLKQLTLSLELSQRREFLYFSKKTSQKNIVARLKNIKIKK
jgi:hypothetical protein